MPFLNKEDLISLDKGIVYHRQRCLFHNAICDTIHKLNLEYDIHTKKARRPDFDDDCLYDSPAFDYYNEEHERVNNDPQPIHFMYLTDMRLQQHIREDDENTPTWQYYNIRDGPSTDVPFVKFAGHGFSQYSNTKIVFDVRHKFQGQGPSIAICNKTHSYGKRYISFVFENGRFDVHDPPSQISIGVMRPTKKKQWFTNWKDTTIDIQEDNIIEQLHSMKKPSESYDEPVDCIIITPSYTEHKSLLRTIHWRKKKKPDYWYAPVREFAHEVGILVDLNVGELSFYSHGIHQGIVQKGLKGEYVFFVQVSARRPLYAHEHQLTFCAKTYE